MASDAVAWGDRVIRPELGVLGMGSRAGRPWPRTVSGARVIRAAARPTVGQRGISGAGRSSRCCGDSAGARRGMSPEEGAPEREWIIQECRSPSEGRAPAAPLPDTPGWRRLSPPNYVIFVNHVNDIPLCLC